MKHAMQIIGLSCLIILIILSIVSVQTKAQKEKEASESLSIAVNDAVEEISESKIHTCETDEELVAAFEQLLLSKLSVSGATEGEETTEGDPNFSITTNIVDVDAEEGLLAVKVKETFSYPNNKIGEIEDVALFTFEEETEKAMFTFTFVNPDSLIDTIEHQCWENVPQKEIHTYKIEADQKMLVPPSPKVKIHTYKKHQRPNVTDSVTEKKVTSWVVIESSAPELTVGSSYTKSQLEALIVGRTISGDVTFEAVYN